MRKKHYFDKEKMIEGIIYYRKHKDLLPETYGQLIELFNNILQKNKYRGYGDYYKDEFLSRCHLNWTYGLRSFNIEMKDKVFSYFTMVTEKSIRQTIGNVNKWKDAEKNYRKAYSEYTNSFSNIEMENIDYDKLDEN